MFWFFGLPPLAPNRPLPSAIFDGICDVLCTSSTPQKRAVFVPRGGGRRHMARPPIAKAKATPRAMRFNMPGIRCLVHRRIIYRRATARAADPSPGGGLASYDFDDQTQKTALDGSKVFKGQLETKWTSFWPTKGYLSTARFASCLPCSFSPLLTPSFSNFQINCLFATI